MLSSGVEGGQAGPPVVTAASLRLLLHHMYDRLWEEALCCPTRCCPRPHRPPHPCRDAVIKNEEDATTLLSISHFLGAEGLTATCDQASMAP